jgi:thiamine phosphate synthase YjbQ (UPF0047 family)
LGNEPMADIVQDFCRTHQEARIVKGGAMQLGPWQGVFLCEFDGPRIRHVWIR